MTVGESFGGEIVGGWLVANSVVGYSAIDLLFLKKNITSDIADYLELPDIPEEPDVAVPYNPKEPPPEAPLEAVDQNKQDKDKIV